MTVRKRLGEIFIEQGIITEKTVARVLGKAKLLNQRFGTVLEEMELVSGEELATALALQYGFKVVTNLLNFTYSQELLRIIPAEVCIAQALFPLRCEQGKLALAMADPTNTKVVNIIAENHNLTITPFIATREQIYAAICKYYLGKEYISSASDTVLIVDDDPLTLKTFKTILENNNYRVITATDGMEAFKKVIAEKPQVIVTALTMPKLDGFGFFAALQNLPEMIFTPVLLVSESITDNEEALAFNKGFFDFMLKPVKEVTLLTRIRRAFIFQKHRYRFIS